VGGTSQVVGGAATAHATETAELEATSDPRSDRDDRVIDDEFVDAMRRNIGWVVDLIGDRITVERERRGGLGWGGF